MVDRNANPRARVFISCGQNKATDETTTAREIGRRLEGLGYEPYIAGQEQTLRGLKENIFEKLRESEYFVFVDFKRERLGDTTPPEHRGSLFSHQELAIAAYLEKPTLILQEKGIKQLDGLLICLQANMEAFTDRPHLPDIIGSKVLDRKWDPNWRNDLFLEVGEVFHNVQVAIANANNILGRFFTINVRNRHRDKIARNCYAYLERATDVGTHRQIPFRPSELKWSGYTLPNAHILPVRPRSLDAFWVPHDAPDRLIFQLFTDSGMHTPIIQGRGTYELEYMVIADEFPIARCSATVELDGATLPTTLTVR